PHQAQLIRVDRPRTVAEALKTVASNSNKTPSWIQAEGGVAGVAPGQTGTAVLNLPAGQYAVVDLVNGPSSNGPPPAVMNLTVASGTKGSLPSTPVTITAAAPGKDKYKWVLSGALQSG